MTPNDEALAWTCAILGVFAEAVKVGELSTGLEILAELNELQHVDVINNSITLLDRGMAGQLPGAPARLSAFGGITIPPASELDARGYTATARGVLVSIWNHRAEPLLTDLARRRGIKYTTGVVVLATACMLLTWQLETDQPLAAILDQLQ